MITESIDLDESSFASFSNYQVFFLFLLSVYGTLLCTIVLGPPDSRSLASATVRIRRTAALQWDQDKECGSSESPSPLPLLSLFFLLPPPLFNGGPTRSTSPLNSGSPLTSQGSSNICATCGISQSNPAKLY